MKSLLAVVIIGLAILARACFAGVPNVAIALQYHDPTTLIGVNMVRRPQTGELVVFDNSFECLRWARLFVANEKDKNIAIGCQPIPEVAPKSTSHVSRTIVPTSTPLEDIAIAFEYGPTHQLVVVKGLGRADNDKDCIRRGNDTISSTKITPGWVVVITCIQVPAFPPASSTL